MKKYMDEDFQEDALACEMQALFEDYKAGDVQAYERILAMQARYGILLGKSGKEVVNDLLRHRLNFEGKNN